MSDKPNFLDEPPVDARLTEYDRAHLPTYLRLLDAETEGAPWEEVANIIFGIDAQTDPARAEQMYKNHLARARWMTENGFRDLIRSRFH
jgi:hypothetical protein